MQLDDHGFPGAGFTSNLARLWLSLIRVELVPPLVRRSNER